MMVLTVASVLVRDHFRRGVIIGEAFMLAVLIALFLNPRHSPYEWSYLGMVYTMAACVVPAVSTSMLASRAADTKAEVFLLRAGRNRYYIGVFLAATLTSLFWLALLFGVLPILTVTGCSRHAVCLVILGVCMNTFLTTGIFLAFSAVNGATIQIFLAIILQILGLNPPSSLLPSGTEWIDALLPPLAQNITAGLGNTPPNVLRSMLYVLAVLGIGVWRFKRRELHWA